MMLVWCDGVVVDGWDVEVMVLRCCCEDRSLMKQNLHHVT